mgnify:CR=1 FL=1
MTRIHSLAATLVAACLVGMVPISGCGGSQGRGADGEPPLASRDPGEIRASAVEMLQELSGHQRPVIRANAIEAASVLPRARLEPLVALGLSDENEGVRSVAAMVVGQRGLDGLRPTLESLRVDDASPFVRCSAIYALHEIGTEPDLTPLAGYLLESDDIKLSSHAAFVLGELGNNSAVPVLEQGASKRWPRESPIQRRIFRLQIAEAMIKLGESEELDAVRSALYPSRPEELEATALAVQILGEVRDRGSVDQLIYMANEETGLEMPAEVRLGIASTLADLGLRNGGYIADEYADHDMDVLRAQAATVYGVIGRREYLGTLAEMMGDESPLVRVAAASSVVRSVGD